MLRFVTTPVGGLPKCDIGLYVGPGWINDYFAPELALSFIECAEQLLTRLHRQGSDLPRQLLLVTKCFIAKKELPGVRLVGRLHR